MKSKRPPRVDDRGRAFAGSQLQTQIYVSRRTGELNREVGKAIGVEPAAIEWVAPKEEARFREPMDGSFLHALQLGHLRPQLQAFWPKRGPSWDALALIAGPSGPEGYILAEGKSYPTEMFGKGCGAGDSRATIEHSISKAKAYYGVNSKVDWMGVLYQYANRLAHIHFLMEQTGKPAWLVNLCFIEDPTKGATSREEWIEALPNIKKKLGFAAMIPHTADVYLQGLERGALLEVTAR